MTIDNFNITSLDDCGLITAKKRIKIPLTLISKQIESILSRINFEMIVLINSVINNATSDHHPCSTNSWDMESLAAELLDAVAKIDDDRCPYSITSGNIKVTRYQGGSLNLIFSIKDCFSLANTSGLSFLNVSD